MLALFMLLSVLGLMLVTVACGGDDDEERLAAQRLFRSYLLQSERTAISDVRVQGMVDELPPSFPEHEQLDLLGSAFTDTQTRRELIIGWQSDDEHADDLYSWFRSRLDNRSLARHCRSTARRRRLHHLPRRPTIRPSAASCVSRKKEIEPSWC